MNPINFGTHEGNISKHLLYSKDVLLASFTNFELDTVYNEYLLPLYFNRYNDLKYWLESRAIDSHRPSSRLLKKALRLAERDDTNTVLSQYAQTLTDTYWVKSEGVDLNYNGIRADFNSNIASLSLTASYDSFNDLAMSSSKSITYELTNVGSFEKCWYKHGNIIESEWCMIKRATPQEAFSELVAYYLNKQLNFSTAEYSLTQEGYIESINFASKYNFEPMWNIVLDNDDYDLTIKALQNLEEKYNVDLISDFLKIIFVDTLIANPDRHTKNYGILRDIDTGSIISLAPNYDNNLSLVSMKFPISINRSNDFLVKEFNKMKNLYPQCFLWMNNIHLSKEDVLNILIAANDDINNFYSIEELSTLSQYVYNAYKQIK